MPDLVLADDNFTTQRVLELSLADEDVTVRSFGRGADALAHLEENPAEIAFLNVSLRDIDGYTLCRKIKSNRATSRTSVVLLVGAFQVFDEERARRAGCRAHLAKPFETSQLLSLVNEILAEPESEPDSAFFLPEGYLFHVPLREARGEAIVHFDKAQRRPAFQVLERDIALPAAPVFEVGDVAVGGAGPVGAVARPEELQQLLDQSQLDNPEEFRRLVEKLAERLPQELRRLLPEMVRDISAREE